MRIEHDFLGELEVPDNAYYGVQSLRGSHNFNITGQKLDSDFIIALAMVKKAAAMANLKTARLDSKIAKALIAAADEIIDGKLHDNFIVDPIQGGAGTSINMNMNSTTAVGNSPDFLKLPYYSLQSLDIRIMQRRGNKLYSVFIYIFVSGFSDRRDR